MQIPDALARRFHCPIGFHTLLAEDGGLKGFNVRFVRCDGCGKDGRLLVDGENQLQSRDHAAWRELLPYLRQAMDLGTFFQVRRAIAEATWMSGFEPLPETIVMPTDREIEQHGGVQDPFYAVVGHFLRLGGDPR